MSHRVFRRDLADEKPTHRCVECGTPCPTLADKRAHDRVTYAEHLAETRAILDLLDNIAPRPREEGTR